MKAKASGRFFEKKLRKKLLLVWAVGVANSRRLRSKSFLVLRVPMAERSEG
jgi:hypothetical protein